MRRPTTRESIRALMVELARGASGDEAGRIYLVGGATAVWTGWRESTVDVDLHGEPDRLFRDVQRIKEHLEVNIEFVRPEDFVPELAGADGRHVFIERIGAVSFYHHDPYAQTFSKVVRGFERDLKDAESFVTSGMVETSRLRELTHGVPEEEYAKYPALTRDAVLEAVDAFVASVSGG